METLINTLHWKLYNTTNPFPFSIREKTENDQWVLIFVRQGRLIIRSNPQKELHPIHGGECNLLYIPKGHSAYYNFTPDEIPVKALKITLTSPFLQGLLSPVEKRIQYLTEQENKISVYNLCNKSIHADMSRHIECLLENTEDEFYNKIRLEAFIMHLTVDIITLFKTYNGCNACCQLKPHQYEKIKKAETFIRENLQEPCSLISLAKQVGTNDCTLKKGFKEIYGTTIFNYFKDIRMQKALELLRTTDMDIGQIADELGYKNHSNFSQSFKKKYGYSPKSVREAIFA